VPTTIKKEAGLNQPLFFQGLELFLKNGFSRARTRREASLLALFYGFTPPALRFGVLGINRTAVLVAAPAVLHMIKGLVHAIMFPELRLICTSAARQERNHYNEQKQLFHDSNPPFLN
jgi:hypothetical protein